MNDIPLDQYALAHLLRISWKLGLITETVYNTCLKGMDPMVSKAILIYAILKSKSLSGRFNGMDFGKSNYFLSGKVKTR